MNGPFMPLEAPTQQGKPKRVLPLFALGMTAFGLASSVLLGVLVLVGIIPVPWDAVVLPRVVLGGVVPLCTISFIVSGISLCLHRNVTSCAAVILGLLAIVAALGALFVIVATGIANHPI
jgi:hypothetical protein